jgi:osmotically-inducible protein OsmY
MAGKMRFIPAVILSVVMIAVMFLNIGFAVPPEKGKMTDSMLETFIKYRLMQNKLLVNDNISVSVADSVITLSGTVATIGQKNEAAKITRRIEENYQIVNNISIAPTELSDKEIEEAVVKKIRNHVFYSIFDWVTVDVNNGVVALKGWIHLPWGGKQYIIEAEKVPGVVKVVDDIKYERGSDATRVRAARLIYNDSRFESYAYSVDPPIHIIVNGPDIILYGAVRSESDKSWAETLLTFNTDAVQVINHLKVEPNAKM